MKLKIYQPNGIIGVVLKWGITDGIFPKVANTKHKS